MVALGMAVILPVHSAGVRTGPSARSAWTRAASGYPDGLAPATQEHQ